MNVAASVSNCLRTLALLVLGALYISSVYFHAKLKATMNYQRVGLGRYSLKKVHIGKKKKRIRMHVF
jgi:hypothetical protein